MQHKTMRQSYNPTLLYTLGPCMPLTYSPSGYYYAASPATITPSHSGHHPALVQSSPSPSNYSFAGSSAGSPTAATSPSGLCTLDSSPPSASSRTPVDESPLRGQGSEVRLDRPFKIQRSRRYALASPPIEYWALNDYSFCIDMSRCLHKLSSLAMTPMYPW